MAEDITQTTDLSEPEFFGISAVSRLTGISSHVLRIWERRYQVVDPGRTDSKRRQYTREDIRRLTLLKTLTDSGHSIGNLAKLSTEALDQRLQETEAADVEGPSPVSAIDNFHTCRAAFAGAIARDAIREVADATPALQLIGEFDDLDSLATTLRPGAVDLLIVETPTLFPPLIEKIQRTVDRLKARRAIIVYQFAQSEAIGPLSQDIPSVTAMRAPVDATELQLACLADVRTPRAPVTSIADTASKSASFPDADDANIVPRQFSDRDLAQIARMSSAIKCECPQHLANLLTSLTAFENYSAACANLNKEDAKLHAYLHQSTAGCRAQMEETMLRLLEAEGIEIPSSQS